MLASIPSPGSNAIDIGPLTFRAYGLMIALGVIAAVWLAGKRLAERGYPPELAGSLAMVGVPAGLVGARVHHVITDWRSFQGNWGDAIKIWEGGLGIAGAVLAGAAAVLWYSRRNRLPIGVVLDATAPAIPLAQAIGRLGNWFNQELFGRPTDLPWGLEIDLDHRPVQYLDRETFHPTFLYESLWNVGVVLVLLWLSRRRVLRTGRLFAVYAGLYAIGRLWVESMRIDPSSEIAGVRVNIWIYSIVLAISVAVVLTGRRPVDEWGEPYDEVLTDGPEPADEDEDVDEELESDESIDDGVSIGMEREAVDEGDG
ncbi:MAG: prolipoprotein diacylglyceryl transferase [Acidimicrobiales bacterium]|nr:prolipoprotein diacylglyceryl transferase [Acidimicrobiales bacterium]